MPRWPDQYQDDEINTKVTRSIPRWKGQYQDDKINTKAKRSVPIWRDQYQGNRINTKMMRLIQIEEVNTKMTRSIPKWPVQYQSDQVNTTVIIINLKFDVDNCGKKLQNLTTCSYKCQYCVLFCKCQNKICAKMPLVILVSMARRKRAFTIN